MAFGIIAAHEAAIWLVPFFIDRKAAACIKGHISLKVSSLSGIVEDGMLTSYVQDVTKLWGTYTKDITS